MQRILGKNVFDIGHEQFLMLLLMMQADRENRLDLIEQLFVGAFEQFLNVGIDRAPKAISFRHRRPRDESSQIAPVHVARSVIIGIKKVGVFRNFRLVARHPDFQNESLEEPARVREMPFGRADVRHRLHDVIFRLERRAEAFREFPDLVKTRQQAGGAISFSPGDPSPQQVQPDR